MHSLFTCEYNPYKMAIEYLFNLSLNNYMLIR